MPRHFAFLRAINVGGRNVTMDALRGHFVALGFEEVESFIASGNIVFTSRARSAPALRFRIEAHLHRTLGYLIPTFLRSGKQLAAIDSHQPFPPGTMRTAHAVYVGFLGGALTPAATAALLALGDVTNRFHLDGSEIYWLCVRPQNESTVTMAKVERALRTPATFRNRTTIARLVAKYDLDSR